MRKIGLMLFIFVLGISIVACGGDSEPVSQEPEEPVEEEPIEEEPVEEEPIEEEKVFPYTAPLTGIGLMTEIDERIMAVMINNHNQARPQSGLNHADMVYEVLSEGWITRLIALFQSEEPEIIGPVRSIRPYMIDIATGFDAVFAHAGGSNEAIAIVQSKGLASLDDIYNAGGSFYRVNFRKMPHNLYTSMEMLREGAERRGYRQDSEFPTLTFKKQDEEMSGAEAQHVKISYGSGNLEYQVEYQYDAETQLYTRYVQEEPHIDFETEEPLTMTNVFVIETSHRVLDNEGRRAVDVLGEGQGYLFQRGKVQEVDWKRVNGVIRPMNDGEEVGFYPGKTWVNIIPNSPGLEGLEITNE